MMILRISGGKDIEIFHFKFKENLFPTL
jgi:hypothetical protein